MFRQGSRGVLCVFFFSSRRRHTRLQGDWSSDVCSSDLKCGLILSACGAGVILLALAAVRYASFSYTSWPHMVILLGVTVMLYLGFLPEIGRASCRERV